MKKNIKTKQNLCSCFTYFEDGWLVGWLAVRQIDRQTQAQNIRFVACLEDRRYKNCSYIERVGRMDEWTDGREDIQNVHIVKLLKHTNQQTERQTDGSEKQKFLLWLPCLLY